MARNIKKSKFFNLICHVLQLTASRFNKTVEEKVKPRFISIAEIF